MSNHEPRVFGRRQQTFKQVDVSQPVVLNDDYIVANHRTLQLEAIALRTMENAESMARDIVDAARQEAQQILDAARERADAIIQTEGHQQRDAILKQGFEEGYRQGLEQGIMQVTQELADKLMMSDVILEKAFEAEKLLMETRGKRLSNLIHYVVTLILGHELATDKDKVAQLIGKALDQLHTTGNARIILNPETLRMLKESSQATLDAMNALHRIHFHPDGNCAHMEMYVETVDGCYNISAESQAEVYRPTLQAAILAELAQESVEDSENEPAGPALIEAPVDEEILLVSGASPTEPAEVELPQDEAFTDTEPEADGPTGDLL